MASYAATNTQGLEKAIAGLTDSAGFASAAPRLVRQRLVQTTKAAVDAADNTATAEYAFFRAPGSVTVSAVYWTDGTGITANDTNYATLLVQKYDGAGGSAATTATVTTKTTTGSGSGDVTALVPIAVPLSTTKANLQLGAGQLLTFKITKSGSGVKVGGGVLSVEYTED